MTFAKTKIICTIGPSVASLDKILQLIDAGMNVARLNFSHGTHEEHGKVIALLKQAREMKQVALAIMLDTKGPEIRLGPVKDNQFSVVSGEQLLLVREPVSDDTKKVQVTPATVVDVLEVGMNILIDDGYITARVVKKDAAGVTIEIENPGWIKSHKGVNIPGVDIGLPAMTEQDVKDIIFGCEQDVDVIAASFIRSADHVLEIKELLAQQNKSETLVLVKIENALGVHNFDSILQVADGVMVARGDLGVELPLNQVPRLQKMIIRKCYQAAKPVVTATQMLESMIKQPRPTRAEVSDVANAVYDSTSAVMLSAETAAGAYPIEAVKMMRSIVIEAENDFDYKEFLHLSARTDLKDVSTAVAFSSVRTAYNSEAKGIFCFSNSGFTARMISRFRPEMPVVALTPQYKVYHQMALQWGIIPVDPAPAKNMQEAVALTTAFALKKGIMQRGERVVVTAGEPFGVSGTTNMMLVETVH